MRRLRPRLGERYAGHVLPDRADGLSASAAPPAAAPEPNCSVYISGQRLGMLRPLPVCPERSNRESRGRICAGQAGIRAARTAGNQTIAGDIEVLVWEQFSTSKLRISCVDTANQIVYLTGPTAISQTTRRSRLHRRQSISGGERTGPADAAGAMVSRPFDNAVDAHVSGQSGRESEHGYGDRSATRASAGGLGPAIRDVSRIDVRARQLHGAGHGTYSSELEADIGGAVSFQNSQHITFDSGTVTQISGTGWSLSPASTRPRQPTAWPTT